MTEIHFLGLNLSRYFASWDAGALLRLAALLFIGLPTLSISSRWVRRVAAKKYSEHQAMFFCRIVYHSGLFVIVFAVLNEMGFKLTHLLGAAGIVGVAVGFASQTSVSNIISGWFLMAEKPFTINDTIIIDEVTGQVLSIDLLSIKLRTFDNKFVRIPNEIILKGKVINVTRFPTRRLDIKLGLAYREDISRVRQILLDAARQNPFCLPEPAPMVSFSGFGDSSIQLTFEVWARQIDWVNLNNSLHEEIKRRFESEGIEFPYPHLALCSSPDTPPFPVRLAQDK